MNENQELKDFYFKIKSLDISKTLQDEDVPESVQIIACNVWQNRIEALDKLYENNFGPLTESQSCEEACDEQ